MKITFQNYGQVREIKKITPEEIDLFDRLLKIISEAGLDPDPVKLVRKSDNYLSAVVFTENYGEPDILRFKFTPRAKWIVLPLVSSSKIRIESVPDLDEYRDEIIRHYEYAVSYIGK